MACPYLINMDTPILPIRNISKTRKNTRIKPLPYRNAKTPPVSEPAILHTATIPPIAHNTCPDGIKKSNAALNVPRFTSFAEAEAFKKSKPKYLTNRKSNKLPLPGPKIPS